jgi:hypothetical protein
MAVLSETQRAEAWAEYMRQVSRDGEALSLTKADLRAALDATDDWVSDNMIAYNSAIPLPARSELTTSQKARLIMYVVSKRFLEGV